MWQQLKLGFNWGLGVATAVVGFIVMCVVLLLFGLFCIALFSGVALGSSICAWITSDSTQEYTLPHITHHDA